MRLPNVGRFVVPNGPVALRVVHPAVRFRIARRLPVVVVGDLVQGSSVVGQGLVIPSAVLVVVVVEEDSCGLVGAEGVGEV